MVTKSKRASGTRRRSQAVYIRERREPTRLSGNSIRPSVDMKTRVQEGRRRSSTRVRVLFLGITGEMEELMNGVVGRALHHSTVSCHCLSKTCLLN